MGDRADSGPDTTWAHRGPEYPRQVAENYPRSPVKNHKCF